MSKYDPLTEHLRSYRQRELPMRFVEIEEVLGFSLPPSSRHHRAWWSNNPSNSVMTKAWLAAGYQSRDVDMAAEKLVFVRLNEVEKGARTGNHPVWGAMKGTAVINDADPFSQAERPTRHPIFGAMKRMIQIPDGVDLTEPSDPDWADLLVEKYGRPSGE